MYAFLIKGGILMIPIGICSLISLTVFLERIWSLTGKRIVPMSFLKRIASLFEEEKYSEAKLLCDENDSSLARILGVIAYRGTQGNWSGLNEQIEEQGRQETALLSKDLEVIGTIAAITPLLGLLGTVLGMIGVFQKVETYGVGDPTILASGIWEALITTAAGLSVAIPSFLFYKYLQSRVDGLSLKLESGTRHILERLPISTTEQE